MAKTSLSVILALTFAWFPAWAEDWTTTDGKTYKDVKVVKHDDTGVTILDSDGGASISWDKLPVDVQKSLGHDPEAIAAAQKKADEQKAADDIKAQQQLEATRSQLQTEEDSAQKTYDAAQKIPVKGQVFIVTKSGENVKLGLVGIGLYPESEIKHALESLAADALSKTKAMDGQKKQFDANFKADYSKMVAWPVNDTDGMTKFHDKVQAEATDFRVFLRKYYYFFSAQYYSEGLPSPVASSKTDADGQFTIAVPQNGTWVLSAYGERLAGSKKENYLWITKITPAQLANSQVLLSNDNMISSDNPDSMISVLTADAIKDLVDTVDNAVPEENVDHSGE